ncbi:MAG TPA: hypothetical protein VGF55_02030 [Gemmataceae bacterium]|jgi:hypothetical protein
MNILRAVYDENLFRPYFGDDLTSWRPWLTALRVVYGLPVKSPAGCDLIRRCTGRDPAKLTGDGFQTSLFLCGRRSGKSRAAAVAGAYEAALAGHETKLARGERGVVAVCAPTRYQARVVKDYLAAIFTAPLLAGEVATVNREGFELRSGTRIEIMAGHFRTVRGYTLLAAIVEEAAFFGLDEESKVRSDTELVRAIKPGLATVGGRLISITSPYAKKGWTYATFKKHYGLDGAKVLVWKCPSTVMNPTLPPAVVAEALEEDPQAARSEWLGEFREDVAEFVPRVVAEALVVPGRLELPPRPGVKYVAFVDVSGGRGDDAALAVGHREGRAAVVDLLRRYRPPFSPYEVVGQMVKELRRYGVRRVVGDNYAAEWVSRAFVAAGVRYLRCPKPKSDLYRELLPRLSSAEVQLLDDKSLIDQIAGLERRTRSGGRDVIDHPPGGHDDLANAVAGVADAAAGAVRIGPVRPRPGGPGAEREVAI